MHICSSGVASDIELVRFVELLNEKTSTLDWCLDDSASLSDVVNFEFMKWDERYECKIELLGCFVAEKTNDSVLVDASSPIVVVGNRRLIEVDANGDTYYVSVSELEGIDLNATPFFSFSRKDLIQVDDIVHPRCHWDVW